MQEHFQNNVTADEVELVGQFVGELVDQLGLRDVTIAFVDERLDQFAVNQLGELAAVSRGVKGKVFTNFGEAEAWLLKE